MACGLAASDLDGPLNYLLRHLCLGLKCNCNTLLERREWSLLEIAMAAEMYFAHGLRNSRGRLLKLISPMSGKLQWINLQLKSYHQWWTRMTAIDG